MESAIDEGTTERLDSDRRTERVAAEVGSGVGSPVLVRGRKLRGGRYMLDRRLGFGGMAVVWLARDERLGRQVAIKILSDTLAGDESYLTRFGREARVAARLSHPNLVSIYDFEASERPFLVMEYVEGGNLGEVIDTEHAPDVERLAAELLSALAHIHEAGVLHRDVKPANVLVGLDGRARLTDFGIAQPRDATSLTQTGHVLGTESYLAPEVLAGEQATERSDLFGLGVLLAEVAEAAGGAPMEVERLIERLRQPDPARRPVSAEAALVALERAVSPPPAALGERTRPFAPALAAPPPPPALRGATRAAAGRRAAIGAVLAALAIGLLLVIATGNGGDGGDGGARQAGDSAQKSDEKPAGDAAAPTTPGAQGGAPASEPTGAELNEQGHALIGEGRYEEAIPVLQQAVAALEGTGEITYAYALYNLGHALRLAGRPEEAIPILEQRLEIPDQIGVVRQELAAARADAGLTTDTADDGGVEADEDKPGKGSKPGKGPKQKD